jgi:hypothetical protein
MLTLFKLRRRLLAVALASTIAALGIAAVALAMGGARDSKAAKVKIKCPSRVVAGRKVTCKLFGKLPQGPQGKPGKQGPKGQKGATGAKGAAGSSGVSGFEVVSETFKDVFVVNSGGQRGLSEVKTVTCPAKKRALGGGADLGTNDAQNGQQRQVTLSLSGPNGGASGWSVQLFNNSTSLDTSIDLKVYAICASVG